MSAAFLGAFGGGISAHATVQEDSPYGVFAQFGRVLKQVEEHYVDPVDRRKLLTGALKGMVGELDPHSSYLPEEEYRLFRSSTEGRFGGVGIDVDGSQGLLTVVAPMEGSPAERGGVLPGDVIVRIDDEEVQGVALSRVVKRMRGVPGTHVKLTLKRDGAKDLVTVDLVRDVIRVASVKQKMLDGGVAYLRLSQFQERTYEELLVALGQLRQAGALTAVVLDLRDNPGGLVDQATAVADEFLASGVVYTARHRGVVTEEVKAGGGGALTQLPVVVLVNASSASAAELLTGALQDNGRAVVVGSPTFGKGIIQTIVDLPDGAGLELTTARYYTPLGQPIQAQGIEPDVVVEGDEAGPPPLRERNLEGHIESEVGKPRNAQPVKPRAGTKTAAPAGEGGGTTTPSSRGSVRRPRLGDVKTMPADPSRGTDEILRVGYGLARGLVGKGPHVRK